MQVTFAVSIPLALNVGLPYTWSVWCEPLKERFGLDQAHLQLIASACNAGGYSSLIG